MKLQYLTVIFVIIFIPIILVSAYYINRQMETVSIQLEYDSDILDATHDALLAFEINTANEDLSNVSDSLRSIIEASNNILLNTLAVNMGISNANKSYVQPYVPAVLYTLYDGYYLYAPTHNPIICVDKFGQTITTDSFGVKFDGGTDGIGRYIFDQDAVEYDGGNESVVATGGPTVDFDNQNYKSYREEYGQILYENEPGADGKVTYSTKIHAGTKYKISYMLKSYVPYASTYENIEKNIKVTINYTLDNFMTIYGTIGDIYFSKSGYFIDEDLVQGIEVDNSSTNYGKYSSTQIEEMIEDPENYLVKIKLKDGIEISNRSNMKIDGEKKQYWQDAIDATKYYAKAWIFSNWVRENLGVLEEKNIIKEVYNIVNENLHTEFKDSDGSSVGLLEEFNSENAIFDSEENFIEHKRKSIKNSILYNLAVAMTAYNEKYGMGRYQIPIVRDVEWDEILSKPSILTFMQGKSCGYKYYNNYAYVCSDNNEISVNPNEIYYAVYENDTSFEDNDKNETVHRINCPLLDFKYDGAKIATDQDIYYASVKSKDIKYDKLYNSEENRYDYDHKVYSCYRCIVDSNFKGVSGKKNGSDENIWEMFPTDNILSKSKIRAYFIAVGKENERLYKPTALAQNYGIEIFNYPEPDGKINNLQDSVNLKNEEGAVGTKLDFNRVFRLEITFGDVTLNDGIKNVYTTNLTIALNDHSYEFIPITISTTAKANRTIVLEGDFSNEAPGEKLKNISFNFSNNGVNMNVKSVKVFYK